MSRLAEDVARTFIFERAAKVANANVNEADLTAWLNLCNGRVDTGEADYIVTGDQRAGLLQRGSIGRTRIVTQPPFAPTCKFSVKTKEPSQLRI